MSRKKSTLLRLEGALGLRDADALAGRLKDAVATDASIEIDARALAEIDVSNIQLLAAAQKSAAALGRGFAIVSPPGGALRQALVRLGILTSGEACRTAAEAFWLGGVTAAGGRAS